MNPLRNIDKEKHHIVFIPVKNEERRKPKKKNTYEKKREHKPEKKN